MSSTRETSSVKTSPDAGRPPLPRNEVSDLDPLLELQHTCLALGFQGVHRSSPNGQASLQQIQRNLYETLRRVRPKVAHDLSPRWQGQKLASQSSRFRVPLWAVASIVLALLVGLYITLLTLLSGGSDAVASSAMTLHPSDRVEIARRVIAPPPPPPPPPPQGPAPAPAAAPAPEAAPAAPVAPPAQ